MSRVFYCHLSKKDHQGDHRPQYQCDEQSRAVPRLWRPPHRIGSTHEGTLLAISQNRPLELSNTSVDSLHGIKAGINQPLHYQGEIIGGIGITGEPEHLRAFEEPLKMTAEMIVEQANSLETLNFGLQRQVATDTVSAPDR